MNSKTNIFQQILYKSAGVDLEVIEKCPDIEKRKYSGIGAIVIITAIFSAIAGFYAIQLMTGNIIISVLIGGMFGLLIGLMDRLTFSTITRRYSRWGQILQIIPKFILAVLIAIILVKPLELKIFEREIVSQIKTSSELKDENSFLARVKAFNELKSKEKAVSYISYSLLILMILLETMPIFVKLLSSEGMYESIMEQRDNLLYKREVQQLEMENEIKKEIAITQRKFLENKALINLPIFDKIKSQIERDDLKAAINDLFYILEQNNLENEEKDLLILASQVKQLRNQIAHGTIDFDFSSRELNRLRENLLTLTINLEKNENLKLTNNQKIAIPTKNQLK